MTIADAPWQAKVATIVLSMCALALAQVFSYLQNGGPGWAFAIACLQLLAGALPAYGVRPWHAAGELLERAGELVRRGKGQD